jgi:hypothetical protein
VTTPKGAPTTDATNIVSQVSLPLTPLDVAPIAQLRVGLERLGFFEYACK